jgi:hypothetical protein
MKRLYNAVCTWLEADAKAKAESPQPDHQPEGNNFAQAEHAHSYTSMPELHSGYREQSIDDDNGAYGRPISLRWTPNG